MKIEITNNENFKKFFVKFKIPFVSKSLMFNLNFYSTPETWVYGYSSRTETGRYVLFHDYDYLDLDAVIEELKWLQKKFNLSDYYVFCSPDKKDSFHAVCLDTFSLSKAYSIQKQTSCDSAFIHAVKYLASKEWILRLSKKGSRPSPAFVKIIGSDHQTRTKSLAHAEFLKKMGIPISFKGKFDGCKKIGLIKYNTSNRTKSTEFPKNV